MGAEAWVGVVAICVTILGSTLGVVYKVGHAVAEMKATRAEIHAVHAAMDKMREDIKAEVKAIREDFKEDRSAVWREMDKLRDRMTRIEANGRG